MLRPFMVNCLLIARRSPRSGRGQERRQLKGLDWKSPRSEPFATGFADRRPFAGEKAQAHHIRRFAVLPYVLAKERLALEAESLMHLPDRLVVDQDLAIELVQGKLPKRMLDDEVLDIGAEALTPHRRVGQIVGPG